MTCTHVASARVEAASRREETTVGPMMAVMTAQKARLPFARVLTRRVFGPMAASLPARCAGMPRRWTTPVPRRPGIVRELLGVIMSFAAFVIKLARETWMISDLHARNFTEYCEGAEPTRRG